MKKIEFGLFLATWLVFLSCQSQHINKVTITNTLDMPRSFETVEIKKSDLKLTKNESFEKLSIYCNETKTTLVSQFVDKNLDGLFDVILFQPEIGAKMSKQFTIKPTENQNKPHAIQYCFSRFVPERTDDYAWENNRVAFRTFGPVAQKMVEDNIKGGTLTSGIDAWLKKVDYPIINKWYKKAETQIGAYHKDYGEGLDNFHVGVSRGIGGIAIKKDSIYYVSKNFINWKTITTGPIRTSFILEYDNWDANGQSISETKFISLDYGSNLSKFEITLTGSESLWAGITLHENDGVATQNTNNGWVSYWQPHDGSQLGSAILVPNNQLIDSELFVTPLKDQSNLYAKIKINDGKAVYYAGFGWKESNQFNSKNDWENYLNNFIKKINNPLVVNFN